MAPALRMTRFSKRCYQFFFVFFCSSFLSYYPFLSTCNIFAIPNVIIFFLVLLLSVYLVFLMEKDCDGSFFFFASSCLANCSTSWLESRIRKSTSNAFLIHIFGMIHLPTLTCIVHERHLRCRNQCKGKVAIQLCNAKDPDYPSYFLPRSYKAPCNRTLKKYSDNQSRGTLLSTHFFSPSLAPIRSANVSRVSLIAAFGCFGNLCQSLASSSALSITQDTHCCFKTSTRPSFVSSFPSTAFLNSSKSSDEIRRLGPFEGFIGMVASDSAVLIPLAAVDELSRVFWRLIGFNGIRGGSINLPFTCGDAFTGLVEILGFQYEVEYGSIGNCGFSNSVSLGNRTYEGGRTHQDVELEVREIQDI